MESAFSFQCGVEFFAFISFWRKHFFYGKKAEMKSTKNFVLHSISLLLKIALNFSKFKTSINGEVTLEAAWPSGQGTGEGRGFKSRSVCLARVVSM